MRLQFDSTAYLLLLSLTFLVFHLAPKNLRVMVLLVASLIFYGSWNAPFLLLVFYSAIVDFVVARKIQRIEDPRAKKRWLIVSLVSNLSVLVLFKYANFIRESLHLALPDFEAVSEPWKIILPIGISFYTFQTMSYSIDVYKGRIKPESSFIDFMLYVCFFPQLIAGPIERAGHLMPQIKAVSSYRLKSEHVHVGLLLLAWGLFKKAALADNLARIVEVSYGNPGAYEGLDLLLATYAFAFQIFFDFSAYSDMARGAASLFGIKLVRNFDLPYLAENPSDFWRRWHISLSEWIRDYLYFPLGGSKNGVSRTLANLTIAMALAGLWHGAAWHFVIWGLFHGALLVLYRILGPAFSRATTFLPLWAAKGLRIGLMFHLACLGWIFFRAKSMADASTIVQQIGSWIAAGLPANQGAAGFALIILVLTFALMIWSEKDKVFHRLAQTPLGFASLVAVALILTAIFAPEVASPFIYFQF